MKILKPQAAPAAEEFGSALTNLKLFYIFPALLLAMPASGVVANDATSASWGNTAEIITALATVAAVVIAGFTIAAKRRDDRRTDRLNRVNRQLSQLYGKLKILNDAGVRDWYAFVSQHGNDNPALGREFMRFFPYEEKEAEPSTFFNPAPPNATQLKVYREWLRALFMKTNEGILEAVIANADLVVGETMPKVLVDFAEHVASLRLLLLKLKEEEERDESSFLTEWQEYTKLMAPHPSGLGNYINACFEVLKKEQEKLLSTHGTPLTEKQITAEIKIAEWAHQSYWSNKEHKIRAKVGQHYLFIPVPKPESK